MQVHSEPTRLRGATIIAAMAAMVIAVLHSIIVPALVWLVSRALTRWWTRDLGGLTGDTYTALCEIGKVVTLASLTVRI